MRIFIYIFSVLSIFIAGMSFQMNKEAVETIEFIDVEAEGLAWKEHELEKDVILMQEREHPLYLTTTFFGSFFAALFDKLVNLLYAIASLFFSG